MSSGCAGAVNTDSHGQPTACGPLRACWGEEAHRGDWTRGEWDTAGLDSAGANTFWIRAVLVISR